MHQTDESDISLFVSPDEMASNDSLLLPSFLVSLPVTSFLRSSRSTNPRQKGTTQMSRRTDRRHPPFGHGGLGCRAC